MAEVDFCFLYPSSFYKKLDEFPKSIPNGISTNLHIVEEWINNFKFNFKLTEKYTPGQLTYIPIILNNLESFFSIEYIKLFPSNILDSLSREDSDLYILFINTWEATGTQEYRSGIPRKFLSLIKDLGIKKGKLLWVSNDLNIRYNVDLFNIFCNGMLADDPNSNFYTNETVLDNKKFFGLDMFESKPWTREMLKMPKLTKDFLKEENRKLKKRYALSKTGKVRGSRMMIANHLINSNYLDQTYFSWIDVYRHNTKNIDKRSLKYIFNLYYPHENRNGAKAEKFIKNLEYLDNSKPWVLDIDPNAKKNFKHIGFNSNIDRKFLANSYATIVTETDFDELKLGRFFITEKTYQQFAFYHPFILVGVQGLYSYIKKNGYETYPELFDESFDDIMDPVKRFEKILLSLDSFYKTPKQKITDIISSDFFIDKLIHNRDNLENRLKEKNYIEFKDWLLQRGNI